MMWKIRRLWRNITQCYELCKLTWNWFYCDHSQATDLFMYGLKKVVDGIEKRENFVGSEYAVQRGRTILKLGERVFGDYYALLPFERLPNEDMATFMDRYRANRDEFDAAQKKQEKANRIFYQLLNHRLAYLWD